MKIETLSSEVAVVMKFILAGLVLLHARTDDWVFPTYKNAYPYVLIGEDTTRVYPKYSGLTL
jgi:hypothetical protein